MDTVDQAATLIRARGGRVTPARVSVLATLLEASRALTHHELERELARPEPLDRVTLYRVLDWLVRENLAHKIAGDDRVWRFNAIGAETHRHAHFRCVSCHKVFCLENLGTGFALDLPEGFRAEGVELTVEGRCPRCG